MNYLNKAKLPTLLAILIFFTSCNEEALSPSSEFESWTNVEYSEAMISLNENINTVLSETKPKNVTLEAYKHDLINGKASISQSQELRLTQSYGILRDYGKFLAKKNNIKISDDNSYLALGGLFAPEDDLETKYENFNPREFNQKNLSGSDFLYCAAVAIGADFVWALSGSAASTWGRAAMMRAFGRIAARFLGPIGVTLAVASFAGCLYDASRD